jgi:tetratricopeptide (TPR) repeat protein
MRRGAALTVKGSGLALLIAAAAGLLPARALGDPAASSSKAAPKAQAKGSQQWAQKMRKLEKSFQELLVDLNSDERFNAPKNFKRIERNAETFAKLAHELNVKDGSAPDHDPTIPIVAKQFEKEADRAYKTLKWGHRDYARDMLKSMTGYCMACHTRNSSGPSFQSIASSPAVQSLRTLEKGDYYAATRQFDRALEEYERLLSNPANIEHYTFDWEKAVRSGLAIAVRVKKDPDRALSIVDRVLATPKSPFFLKEQASQWKKSLLAWKEESGSKPVTEEGYYSQAVKLVAAAKSFQKYPADRSADILYLRASSAVHDLLAFAPNGKHATEALYLAGLCYEVLHDLNLWDQHEFYYLACIMKSPRTEISRQCFKHYEQSVYLGYTGSGGTHVPREIYAKLQDLDRMSTPAEDAPKPLQ